MFISKETKRLCQIYALAPESVYFCILAAHGLNMREAYYIAFRPTTANAGSVSAAANDLARKYPGVDKLIQTLRAEHNQTTQIESRQKKRADEERNKDKEREREREQNELRTKEGLLNELVKIANSLPQNASERVKVLQQIADIQQMKRDETISEDNTILYYLPLSCARCALYNNVRVNI